jgi:hypothetical protein
MRWRDDDGARWRLRQRRLAWRRWVKPEIAFELFPGGLGQDPISLVIAIPGLIATAVIVPFWLAELVLRLVLAPLATVLRLTSVVPYRLELHRNGMPRGTYTATGRSELVRLRRKLKDTHLAKAGRSQSHPSKA